MDNNIATAKKIGSAILKATIEGTNISSEFKISVTEEPIEDMYDLIVEPDVDYVLQNTSKQFSVYLYKNGIKQEDKVTFSNLTTGIPAGKYEIVVEGDNTFTLTNKGMFMESPVVIRCSCGDYQLELLIKLRGLY